MTATLCPRCGRWPAWARATSLCKGCHLAARWAAGEIVMPRSETCSYEWAHNRVKRDRGPATAHRCEHDGCDRMAEEWSLINGAPGELSEPRPDRANGRPRPPRRWNPNPDAYRPLCKLHHRRTDSAHRRAVRAGTTP